MSDLKDKSIGELAGDLGESVQRLNLLLDNRCVECGSRDVMITRCRICEDQYQREQRTYR